MGQRLKLCAEDRNETARFFQGPSPHWLKMKVLYFAVATMFGVTTNKLSRFKPLSDFHTAKRTTSVPPVGIDSDISLAWVSLGRTSTGLEVFASTEIATSFPNLVDSALTRRTIESLSGEIRGVI